MLLNCFSNKPYKPPMVVDFLGMEDKLWKPAELIGLRTVAEFC